MITQRLRLLLADLSPVETQQIVTRLKQGGHSLAQRTANTPETFRRELTQHTFDIVLCNHDSLTLRSNEALRIHQASQPHTPLLLLSNDNREKSMLEAMRSGASDYILKSEPARLLPSIEHNLRIVRSQAEFHNTQAALQENQARLHAFIANLPGAAYQLLRTADGETGFTYASEGCHALLGLHPQQLEQNFDSFLDMLHAKDRSSFERTMETSAKQMSSWNWEGRILLPGNGESKWINLRSSPRRLENGDILWEGVMFNITQSKVSKQELSRSREQLRALSQHIQDVREEERLNIAREVHDNLGSMLTAIKLNIAWLGNKLSNDAKLKEKATDIEQIVDNCIAATRDISRSLRPSVLDTFGIVAAVEMEAGEFEKRTDMPCLLNQVDHDISLDNETGIALFRIFQEALNNIIKHASATEVQVDLMNKGDRIELRVADNGCGFPVTARRKPRSFGLRGIQERVNHFGGEMGIVSNPESGTTLTVSIPVKQTPPPPQPSLF
jgi:PAS domain S-box-containing protein